MTEDIKKPDRGSVYLRGDTYWIKYYRWGKSYRESAKTDNPDKALRFLKFKPDFLTMHGPHDLGGTHYGDGDCGPYPGNICAPGPPPVCRCTTPYQCDWVCR